MSPVTIAEILELIPVSCNLCNRHPLRALAPAELTVGLAYINLAPLSLRASSARCSRAVPRFAWSAVVIFRSFPSKRLYHATGGAALMLLSAFWDVAWRTPLGPLSRTKVGCNAAAARCRRAGAGFTAAVPPPRYRLGGHHPVFWCAFVPCVTRPRPELSRLLLRGVLFTPLLWAPSTCSLGHHLGARAIYLPQLRLRHILGVVQRRRCAAGGVLDGLAPLRMGATGILFMLKCGHHGSTGNCGRCRNGGHCRASFCRTPRPRAGSSDTLNGACGLDSFTTFV